MKLAHLSLRVRVFLFFAFLAFGGLALLIAGLWIGHARGASGYVLAGLIAGFGWLGLITWVWTLFDEHVARALERLAAELRKRAHTEVDVAFDADAGRYLGDLAPAAQAVAGTLAENQGAMAERIQRETARLARDHARLATLLAEVPAPVLFCGPDHRIVQFNHASARLLGDVAPGPGLGRSVFEVLQADPIKAAFARIAPEATPDMECGLECTSVDGARSFRARLRVVRVPGQETAAPGYMIHLGEVPDTMTTGAGAVDFDILHAPLPARLADAAPRDVPYVVFDTETTGLLPERGDEIVQIAAVRVVAGKIRPEDRFDLLVNPGRRIPAASTQIHGIRDADVAGACDVPRALRRFHAFARDAVLVAHNAPFDMTFLRRREGELGLRFDMPVMDTVLLSAILFGQGEVHTLDAVCERLGVVISENLRHTAIGDAIGTADALVAMLPMLEGTGHATLGAVIKAFDRHKRLIENVN